MKMANIDAVFDYNFTYPKTSDGVGAQFIVEIISLTFMLCVISFSILLSWELSCYTLQTFVLVLVVSPSMCCGEENGMLRDLD